MEQNNQINQQDDTTEIVMEICIDDSPADDTVTDEAIAVFVPEEEGYRYIEDESDYQCNGRCMTGWCSTCDENRERLDYQAHQEWIHEVTANFLDRTYVLS